MVQEIKNLEDFTKAIGDKNTGFVVIDFYADWCGPCKMIAPKFAKMAVKYPSVAFYKLNSDTEQTADIVSACQVNALPTFCLFSGGQFVTKMTGANDAELEEMIVSNMSKNKEPIINA